MSEPPVRRPDSVWRRAVGSAVGAVDHALLAAIHVGGARDRARGNDLSTAERLEALDAAYAAATASTALFPTKPPSLSPTLVEVRTDASVAASAVFGQRMSVVDASWPSTFVPIFDAVAGAYLSRIENRTARARLFFVREKRDTARPAVIAIHGYMGGQWVLEQAQWPVAWLVRQGLSVALPLLPFHALRSGAHRGAPPFPSADPRFTIEGFRQAVGDILALAAILRKRGASHVGVMGMSLGGYTAALLATVSPVIDFVMPMVPLASISDFVRDHGQIGRGHEGALMYAGLERAYAGVSPLSRPLQLPPSRALVVAAEFDRITPRAHAERIAAHFGCAIVTIPGGHLIQLGRSGAFRELQRMLEREGIVEPRPERDRTR